MYKLIVSDLDETLLNDKHEVCKKNIEAIKKASALGVKFVPSTGRGYLSIRKILKDLELYNKEKEYVISFNGGAITENKNNKMLNFNPMPFDKANELFQFGSAKDVCIHIYTAETVYVYNLNENEKNRFVNQKGSYTEVKESSIEFLRNTPIAKVTYQNIDNIYLMNLAHEMKSLTDGSINVSYASNRYLDLTKIGIDKGNGMLVLANLLGIKKEEIIAVGDNYNDMSMLNAAGLSVAAGNAVEDVKKVCGYICKNDNNEGVLAEVIEKFIL